MSTYRSFTDDVDPLRFVGFFDDFLKYAAADWVVTTTEAGAGSATEAVSEAIAGGVLVVTNDDADDDHDFFQLADGAGSIEPFKYVAGKRLRFATRLKVSDAADSDVVAGLQVTDTSPLAVTDGIFFRKSDGDNTVQLIVCKDSTETAVDVAEMADDTFIKLEWYYDGAVLRAYADDVLVAQAALTNAPDDEQLTVSFGVQNGEAAAKVLSVDYIGAWMER